MKEIEEAIGFDSHTMKKPPLFLVRQDLICRQTHRRPMPVQLEPLFDRIKEQVGAI